MARTAKGAKGLRAVQGELFKKGYILLQPQKGGARVASTPSVRTFIQSQLRSGEKQNGRKARAGVPMMFASSGNEQMLSTEGTPTLGWMEWGFGNKLPNTIALLTGMLPFTAAGWKFNTDLLTGMGPQPMYHYSTYSGGALVTKDIPFGEAGIFLKGKIAELEATASAYAEGAKPASIDSQLSTLNEQYAEWEKTNTELQEFLDNNNLKQTYLSLGGDQEMFGICFPEILLSKQNPGEDHKVDNKNWRPKVTGIRYRPAITCRLERMDSNARINYVYCSNRWYDNPYQEQGVTAPIAAYPCLSGESPLKDLRDNVRNTRQKNSKRNTRFIFPSVYPTVGRPYYPIPAWWSIFGGSIYEYAATMIEDRNTRKNNSNIIGRVIYVSQEYLQRIWVQEGVEENKVSIQEIADNLYAEINSWLSNRDNSGKSLMASTFVGADGQEHKSWEIVEIESTSKNTAEANQKELQEISSIIFFAMGLDSKLVGNTPGDTSSSGGTDQRERYLIKQIQKGPTQNILLNSLDVVSRFNEWDRHLVWTIKREVLTTLDNSKTGITESETK